MNTRISTNFSQTKKNYLKIDCGDLCGVAEVQQQVRGVLAAARHVQTRDHNVRAQPAARQLLRHAHLEEAECELTAVVVDRQLIGDL